MAENEAEPRSERRRAARRDAAVREAVDATALAYRAGGLLSVAPYLRSQLEGHGIDDIDEVWLADLAEQISGGRP